MRPRLALFAVLFVLLLATSLAGSPTEPKIASSLALLLSLQQTGSPFPRQAAADAVGVEVAVEAEPGWNPPAGFRPPGRVVGSAGWRPRGGRGLLFAGRAAWDQIERLAADPQVHRIEAAWQPGLTPALDVSVPEIGANAAWLLRSGLAGAGPTVNGQGIVIADFDTGVDVYHPALWRADGGEFAWIDGNGNGQFDSGVDAVDLNGNGRADSGETLRFVKAPIVALGGSSSNNSGALVANLDWVYNDANGNGRRDYGTSFSETAPAFGERVFLIDDRNGNGLLDPGERLIALGTGKVAATLDSKGLTRLRGVNLRLSEPDSTGHGTSVAGILVGGSPGRRRFTGIAPGADLLAADAFSNVPFTTYLPWAQQHGAQIMVYPFGAWVFQYLDGSSPFEQMMDDMSAAGIVQVAAAGNLASGQKHSSVAIPSGSGTSLRFSVPRGIYEIYLTAVWPDPSQTDTQVTFRLTNPSGAAVDLLGDQIWRNFSGFGDGYWSYRDARSSRGAAKFDISVRGRLSSSVRSGTWTLTISNGAPVEVDLHAYVADNLAGWSGGVVFLDAVSADSTVSWPATADSAISVGSYSTRGANAGGVSSFSGRGPRIDGAQLPTLAAPGHVDIITLRSKDLGGVAGGYTWFTGTSAATPHVAGAAALALQRNPGLTPAQVRDILTATARQDSFTGATPNAVAGWGKLDARGTAGAAPGLPDAFVTGTDLPTDLLRGQAYPAAVSLRNNGDTWAAGEAALASQSPPQNATWGLSRVDLDPGESVRPADEKAFHFQITAPATPGNYDCQWQLLDGSGFFGQAAGWMIGVSTFLDVPTRAFAWAYVEAIARAGVTAGCAVNPPQYCPSASVTRGQMAVFLVRAMGETLSSAVTATFADVPTDHPFFAYIERIYELGITAGCATGPLRYCPDSSTSRGEMAVFLVRAVGQTPLTPAAPTFADVPDTHPLYGYIERLYALGITSGCATGPLRYCPYQPVRRDQMAVFLVRAFNLPL